MKCAGEHNTAQCNSEVEKCSNCKWAVTTLKLKLDINHPAYDNNCPTYKRMIERELNSVNYNI